MRYQRSIAKTTQTKGVEDPTTNHQHKQETQKRREVGKQGQKGKHTKEEDD